MANIFRRQNPEIEVLKKELEEKAKELDSLKELLHSELNTIHLYASLTEEETQVQMLKDKQNIIKEICEKVMDEL